MPPAKGQLKPWVDGGGCGWMDIVSCKRSPEIVLRWVVGVSGWMSSAGTLSDGLMDG